MKRPLQIKTLFIKVSLLALGLSANVLESHGMLTDSDEGPRTLERASTSATPRVHQSAEAASFPTLPSSVKNSLSSVCEPIASQMRALIKKVPKEMPGYHHSMILPDLLEKTRLLAEQISTFTGLTSQAHNTLSVNKEWIESELNHLKSPAPQSSHPEDYWQDKAYKSLLDEVHNYFWGTTVLSKFSSSLRSALGGFVENNPNPRTGKSPRPGSIVSSENELPSYNDTLGRIFLAVHPKDIKDLRIYLDLMLESLILIRQKDLVPSDSSTGGPFLRVFLAFSSGIAVSPESVLNKWGSPFLEKTIDFYNAQEKEFLQKHISHQTLQKMTRRDSGLTDSSTSSPLPSEGSAHRSLSSFSRGSSDSRLSHVHEESVEEEGEDENEFDFPFTLSESTENLVFLGSSESLRSPNIQNDSQSPSRSSSTFSLISNDEAADSETTNLKESNNRDETYEWITVPNGSARQSPRFEQTHGENPDWEAVHHRDAAPTEEDAFIPISLTSEAPLILSNNHKRSQKDQNSVPNQDPDSSDDWSWPGHLESSEDGTQMLYIESQESEGEGSHLSQDPNSLLPKSPSAEPSDTGEDWIHLRQPSPKPIISHTTLRQEETPHPTPVSRETVEDLTSSFVFEERPLELDASFQDLSTLVSDSSTLIESTLHLNEVSQEDPQNTSNLVSPAQEETSSHQANLFQRVLESIKSFFLSTRSQGTDLPSQVSPVDRHHPSPNDPHHATGGAEERLLDEETLLHPETFRQVSPAQETSNPEEFSATPLSEHYVLLSNPFLIPSQPGLLNPTEDPNPQPSFFETALERMSQEEITANILEDESTERTQNDQALEEPLLPQPSRLRQEPSLPTSLPLDRTLQASDDTLPNGESQSALPLLPASIPEISSSLGGQSDQGPNLASRFSSSAHFMTSVSRAPMAHQYSWKTSSRFPSSTFSFNSPLDHSSLPSQSTPASMSKNSLPLDFNTLENKSVLYTMGAIGGSIVAFPLSQAIISSSQTQWTSHSLGTSSSRRPFFHDGHPSAYRSTLDTLSNPAIEDSTKEPEMPSGGLCESHARKTPLYLKKRRARLNKRRQTVNFGG